MPLSTSSLSRMPLDSSKWTQFCSTTIHRATTMIGKTPKRLSLSSMANSRICNSRQKVRKSIQQLRRRCKASKIPCRRDILSQATKSLSAISIRGKMRWNRWLSLQSVHSHSQWNTACCSNKRSHLFVLQWMIRLWARSSIPGRNFCQAVEM